MKKFEKKNPREGEAPGCGYESGIKRARQEVIESAG
jgi:hypothetical protein